MKHSNSCCAIIVTYNGEQWINECLETLQGGTLNPAIYVVDNGSQDNTIAIVNLFQEVNLIESDKNLGFGGANNIALKEAFKAGYQYFFLVNQDTRVGEDTVEELVKQVEKTNHNSIVSPIHLDGSGTGLDRVFESVLRKDQGKFPDHKFLLSDFKSGDMRRERYEVKIVNAAFWMLSRKTLEKVGIFHPFFFHYGEDANYLDRARYLGITIVVAGRAKAIHDKTYRSRRWQDPIRFFEKEILKILLDPNKIRGFIHIILGAISGAEIVVLNKRYLKIPRYFMDCLKIYKEMKRKVKNEFADLKVTVD